ncbi:DUF6390 family protein [Streptomyces sp. NPDC059398]|uniref:DUF6390 family protein n=1 Tax=Streptomyces sp. NPDC059398 TaxID=3346820 RepID=UPI0036BEAAFB
MSAEGALLFARYAYPPNELGYCGPDDAAALLRPGAVAGMEERARQFEGAWCYLEFLAECAGVPDPLDVRVVEAYWIGNELLELADSGALVERLTDRFRGQTGGTWREAAHRAVPHHSFQVFDVYPWAALLRASGNPTALSVLDQCRIRTGVVVAVDGESATVESRPLIWDGGVLAPGPARREAARWSTGGRSLIDGVCPGDRVALHWDWICEVISDGQAARIESIEALRHAESNSLAPSP